MFSRPASILRRAEVRFAGRTSIARAKAAPILEEILAATNWSNWSNCTTPTPRHLTTMASARTSAPAKQLFSGFRLSQRVQQQKPCLARSMATTTSTTTTTFEPPAAAATITTDAPQKPTAARPRPKRANGVNFQPSKNPFLTTAQCTLHDFPSFEPTSFVSYPSTHLLMPLRKDILHRAVIYEGDMTRQGTASTKYRSEVHGSNRKIRPQKGTGSARLGDKKSPMLKGGGVAFGPKPRDFSTELPRKIYDQAWRTALSYRYRKGELILVDGELDVDVADGALQRYMRDLLTWQNMQVAGHFSSHRNGGRIFSRRWMERRWAVTRERWRLISST